MRDLGRTLFGKDNELVNMTELPSLMFIVVMVFQVLYRPITE